MLRYKACSDSSNQSNQTESKAKSKTILTTLKIISQP